MKERLTSIDVFRGMTIMLMTIVNNPGDWGHIYAPLEHAEWHGCTPTDLVFPFFLFIVGISTVLSMPVKKFDKSVLERIITRALRIFLLGLSLNFFSKIHLGSLEGIPLMLVRLVFTAIITVLLLGEYDRKKQLYVAVGLFALMMILCFGGFEDFASVRIPGVLQRIAIVYLIVSIIYATTATLPSPIQQKAGIYQKLFNIGISQEYHLNSHWTNVTSVYGTISELRNPFITNYEIRNEQTFGGRTRMNYAFDLGQLKNRFTVGGELQKSAWVIRNFGNKAGVIDTLQTNDNVAAWNYFLFGQLETDLPQNFILTIGGSYNRFKYDFTRLSDAPKIKSISELLPAAFLPRIALLKNIQDKISVFASVSSGFSPPTVTEYISGYQTSTFVPSLAPEKGINYEIGTRGNLLNKRINFDVTAYSFRIKNTIVRRTDNAGREIFTNAGSTLQNGLELSLNSFIIKQVDKEFIQELRLFTSYTFNDYSFKNYLQLKTDLSGNALTGVPRQVWVSGLDLQTKIGVYLNSTFNFTDRMPLNDANTVYANSYKLLNARIGFRKNFKRIGLNIYTAGDNLLNEVYSLGNDINAVGNRFFNAAMPRNWQFGASLSLFL